MLGDACVACGVFYMQCKGEMPDEQTDGGEDEEVPSVSRAKAESIAFVFNCSLLGL